MKSLETGKFYAIACPECGFKGARYMGPWLDIYEGAEQEPEASLYEKFRDIHLFHCENPECGTAFDYKSDEIPDGLKEISPALLPKEQPG